MALTRHGRAGSAKRTRRSIREAALVVLFSLMFAGVASAQTAAAGQAAALAAVGTLDTRFDEALKMPKCARRGSPIEPAHKVVPSKSRRFTVNLALLTLCSLGVRMDPVRALVEQPRGNDGDVKVGPGVAASFEQLQVLVKPGSTVTVVDASGEELSGRIDSLSSAALELVVDGTRRDFGEMDVTAVRQRRHDPLANGARWGLGIGVGLAVLAIASCRECDWGSAPAFAAFVVAGYGAMGTGIGVGVDALIRGQRTVYRRPGAAVSLRF